MDSTTRSTNSVTRLQNKDYAFVCLGFALFFTVSPLSSVGTVAVSSHASGWEQVLWARLLFLLFGGLNIRFQPKKPAFLRNAIATLASVVAISVLYLPGFPAPYSWNLWVYACLLGLGFGACLPGWIQRFGAVYQACGRMHCIIAFSCSYLISTAFAGLIASMTTSPLFSAGVMLISTTAMWACFALSAPLAQEMGSQDIKNRERDYCPTGYTRSIVASLAVTWSLAFNLAPHLGFASPHGPAQTILVPLLYAVCQVTVLLAVRKAGAETARFGLLLRWIIAIIGVGWAFMPICIEVAPFLGCTASVIVFLIESVIVAIFFIELAQEARFPLCAVFRRLALTFISAACGASLLFWLIWALLPISIAASLTAAVAIIASLMLLPVLPSRSSTAGVFTLNQLPEDETVEAKVAQSQQIIVNGYGLTPREAEILALLIQGLSRDEIAERFSISAWTVKNHTRAIYAKTQTHSIQELMTLVYSQR